jgi:hypothetical protein
MADRTKEAEDAKEECIIFSLFFHAFFLSFLKRHQHVCVVS